MLFYIKNFWLDLKAAVCYWNDFCCLLLKVVIYSFHRRLNNISILQKLINLQAYRVFETWKKCVIMVLPILALWTMFSSNKSPAFLVRMKWELPVNQKISVHLSRRFKKKLTSWWVSLRKCDSSHNGIFMQSSPTCCIRMKSPDSQNNDGGAQCNMEITQRV